MITNDHHCSEITHFLQRLINQIHAISPTLIPRRIDVEMSWAMVQAIRIAVNHLNAISFLDWAWLAVHKKKSSREIKLKTYPHLCAAHMIKKFRRNIDIIGLEKGTSEFALRCLAYLLIITELNEAGDYYMNMCCLFGSQKE